MDIKQAVIEQLGDDTILSLGVKAERAGVCTSDMVYKWVRGQSKMEYNRAVKVAAIMGITVKFETKGKI